MKRNFERGCACGSGLPSHWEVDAQNIPLCSVCPECREEKLSKYRPEILTGYTQADVCEDIEPEPSVGPLGRDMDNW
jgi:hypothetical protein